MGKLGGLLPMLATDSPNSFTAGSTPSPLSAAGPGGPGPNVPSPTGGSPPMPPTMADPSAGPNPIASGPNQPPPPAGGAPVPPSMGNPAFGANPITQGQNQQPPAPPPPGPTKGHKLLEILTNGITGALAGRAANEEAIVQSGGRRSGGAGIGFMAGLQAPFQRQATMLNLQKEQAQTELLKSQAGMVDTPFGKMPAGLARAIYPALIQAGSRKEVQGMKGQTAEDIQGQKSDTAESIQGQKSAVTTAGQRYKPIPGIGMFDTQTRQVLPGTAQGVTITPEIAKDHNLPDDFIGKPMKLTDLSSLQRAESGQTATVQGAAGPALVQKSGPNRGQTTPLGLGSPGVATKLAGPMQVADEANPGQTKIVSAGQAIKTGAAGSQSASVAVPKAAMKAEVPTKIGDQKVAFNTMIQHAQLLRQAAAALNNGDQQTLAGLKNRWKNEFGASGPITADAIADAYKGEVSNVINKGHITDQGNEKIAHTLDPSKQNYQTIDSVLGAYQNLAQSKMNMLNQQEQSAVSRSQRGGGGAAPPQTGAPAGATHIVPGPDGKRHYTNATGTVDMGIAP